MLDVALIVALMVQATKLSDFVFTEKQKKSIQNKVEDWTLYLEDLNPRKYFLIIFRKKIARFFAIGIALCILIMLLFFASKNIYNGDEESSFDNFKEIEVNGTQIEVKLKFTDFLLQYKTVFLTVLISLILGQFLAFKLFGFKILEWMLAQGFADLSKKLVLILLSWICITWATFSITDLTDKISSNYWLADVLLLVLLCFVAVGYTISFYGLLVMFYKLLIEILLMVLKFLRWLCWRIVDYNKGAIAAITLIITVVLGVIEVIFKTKK